MAGSAGDVLKFLEALRTGGALILSSTSAKAMTSDQTGGLGPDPGITFAFGLSVVADPVAAQLPYSPGTLTWGGVYGHGWFVDPTRKLSVVGLTNTAIEGMSGSFRADVRNAIYSNWSEENE